MIPFGFMVKTVLDTGIVRIVYNNATWVPVAGDTTFSFTINRTTHKSGVYPKVRLVDLSNHVITGVVVETDYAGTIKLIANAAIPNFTVLILGDDTDNPDPILEPVFSFKNGTVANPGGYTGTLVTLQPTDIGGGVMALTWPSAYRSYLKGGAFEKDWCMYVEFSASPANFSIMTDTMSFNSSWKILSTPGSFDVTTSGGTKLTNYGFPFVPEQRTKFLVMYTLADDTFRFTMNNVDHFQEKHDAIGNVFTPTSGMDMFYNSAGVNIYHMEMFEGNIGYAQAQALFAS